MRNLTGQGDVVEATLEGPRRQENVTRWSLAGRMPLGATGTAVSAQCDRGRSAVVEEPLAAIGIRSILESCEAGVTHTLRETLRNRWAAGLSHVRRTNRTFLLGEPFSFVPGEPDGVTRARSWRLSNEFTHRSETDVVALRALATRVRNNVQDEGFLSVALPDRRYLVWLGQAQYVRHLFEGATRISVRATVQQTKSRLLPFDALPIGGANTVRGYRENQFIRENARILNVEVEHTVWRDSGDGAQFSIAPFVDYGRGSGHDTSSIALSSAGLVVRGRWRGFSASIAVARKLSHPPLPTAGRRDLQDHGMHLEIAYVVF
jgi:hemolysin activation/secretion protein